MWTETSTHNFKTKIKRKDNSRTEQGENVRNSEFTISLKYRIYKRNFKIGFI